MKIWLLRHTNVSYKLVPLVPLPGKMSKGLLSGNKFFPGPIHVSGEMLFRQRSSA